MVLYLCTGSHKQLLGNLRAPPRPPVQVETYSDFGLTYPLGCTLQVAQKSYKSPAVSRHRLRGMPFPTYPRLEWERQSSNYSSSHVMLERRKLFRACGRTQRNQFYAVKRQKASISQRSETSAGTSRHSISIIVRQKASIF